MKIFKPNVVAVLERETSVDKKNTTGTIESPKRKNKKKKKREYIARSSSYMIIVEEINK